MPKHLGEKAKRVGEAAERERAALAAIQTADPEQLASLAEELAAARTAKAEARGVAEDQFVCAWHGSFRGKARVVFEVTGIFVYGFDGETVSEERSRLDPVYLVACPDCEVARGLVEHVRK